MIGKLPKSSKGGHVYLLVAVDKFTKWAEAMPVTNQKGKTAVKFFEFIVYRFGVPHSIITDNGSNFISKEFQDFCEGLGINITYASVAHPQTNGQVEKANGLTGVGIKKRLMSPLERKAGAWTKELPSASKETSSCDSSKSDRRNSSHHGKDPTSSPKSSQVAPIASSTWSLESHTPTHGTSHTCDDSTPSYLPLHFQ